MRVSEMRVQGAAYAGSALRSTGLFDLRSDNDANVAHEQTGKYAGL
jgi:hypothetical protein